MRGIGFALALGIAISGAVPAFAAELCKEHPKDQWLKPEQIKTKAEELGYQVRSVGEDEGCLEVKGVNKEGKKVEVYFDPTTAEVVKTKGG
ncbi:PepSY domain-containing protein [Benzoatithermus flavus]|uniref:PepSY domain-containing protein n=1 Tax=Benzoatithermus flavus TaxID=3108223 RepID=A0ABU8XV80_9PROT